MWARRVDGGRRHDKPADDEKQRQSPQSAHPAAGTLKAARVSDKLSRQLPTASVSSGHVLRPLASTALFVVAKLVCIAAGSLFPASSAQEGAKRPARRGEGEAQAVDEGRSDSCLSQVRPASRDATREG